MKKLKTELGNIYFISEGADLLVYNTLKKILHAEKGGLWLVTTGWPLNLQLLYHTCFNECGGSHL